MAGSSGVGMWLRAAAGGGAELDQLRAPFHDGQRLAVFGGAVGGEPGAGVQGVAPEERDGALAQVDAPDQHVGAAGAVLGDVVVQGGLAAAGGGDDEGVPGALVVVDGQLEAGAGVGDLAEPHRAGHDGPAGRGVRRGPGRGG